MKSSITLFLVGAALLAVSCGNNPKQKTSGPEADPDAVEMTETTPETAPAAKKD